jgi:4-hydroxy-tetrahydrodipicolinate synthase
MGGHGGVTGGANLFPKLYVSLYEAFQKKETETVKKLQATILYLSKNLYTNGAYRSSYLKGLKAAMAFEGLCQGNFAPPLFPYSEAEKAELYENFLRVKDRVQESLVS